MTEQQQREACAELARRMGYTVRVVSGKFGLWRCYKPNGESQSVCAHTSESQAWFSAPDYFNSPVASRELMLWLAAEWTQWKAFFSALSSLVIPAMMESQVYLSRTTETDSATIGPSQAEWAYALLTASPATIARAACKALGIEVSE